MAVRNLDSGYAAAAVIRQKFSGAAVSVAKLDLANLATVRRLAADWLAGGSALDIFKSPAQGASTSVWAAAAPELNGKGGMYLEDCCQGI